ncbi:MAG: hypothetical protein D4R64_18140 [Porphyromonadaceae bacterium]|nr:MAG: hypothetical protein D4R64_18140 [Porphyromonadaceae bacterium]
MIQNNATYLVILLCAWLGIPSCTPNHDLPDDWKARWITSNVTDDSSMPLFRKEFAVGQHLEKARIYISGLGYNELYLNGQKVGDQVLDPAQTNYDTYALYTTYDVSDQLKEGSNRIGIMLGDGWYNQNKAFGIDLSYSKPSFICQVELGYEDRRLEVIGSDTTWEWTEGPVISANVYAGEVYDARKEIRNWSVPGSIDGTWHRAVVAKSYPPALKAQILPPIKKMKELKVKKFYPHGDGTYIFDLGQNFAGWARIRVNEPAGTAIRMRMSEELYPDGSLDFTSTGVGATQHLQADTYICKGEGTEIWEPRFTYHGFRYVEVSGLSTRPDQETLKGVVVYSSVDTVGSFRCSDPQINRLHELALWKLTSNIQGFPSDCPHREKCGWLGDAHAVAPMSIYNFDAWLYKGIAGISPVPENPGFRTIRFEPLLTNQLKWAGATYRSKYGLIKSSWKWQDDQFSWEIIIPSNCEGQVILPFDDFSSSTINGKRDGKERKMLRLGSGRYIIEIKKSGYL